VTDKTSKNNKQHDDQAGSKVIPLRLNDLALPPTPPLESADTKITPLQIPLKVRLKSGLIRGRKRAVKFLFITAPLWVVLGILLVFELKTSYWQSLYLTRIASQATYRLEKGPNPDPYFPSYGPYDQRLGYTRIKGMVENLLNNGFQIAEQTRFSNRFKQLTSMGLFPPYPEKTRAGLTILDKNNTTIYSMYRPERVYESFDAIPDIVVKSLLFIENKEILDQTYPYKNPAVEWDRFGLAILEKLKQIIKPDINAPGGSTIATQLEKYRHSKEGRTKGIKDKFRQMASASLRAYMYGRNTIETRKTITLNYINSIPLAALRGYGEVNGLGDGMWAWFGADFQDINAKLEALSQKQDTKDIVAYAESYKQMLSLFIAHRRPSFYLIAGLSELNSLTNTYLDLLAKEGVISPRLRDAAKDVRLTLRRAAPKITPVSFVQRKAANAIRTRLLQLMQYPQLYDLDQADLTVRSTMDNEANEGVTSVLRQIKDAESVRKFGLSGARNLDRGDPSKVIYSLTLYERVGNANLLRVQTDNFDNPFSINEGTRLDLGSTAKLRTLTTYLDIVGELYDQYSKMVPAQLKAITTRDLDPISRFVLSEFVKNPKISLAKLLDASLQRRYSANPGESFFTGGGLHTFVNFKKEDNGRNPTLQEALTHSINLPFVRLMRDISRHYVYRLGLKLSSSTKSATQASKVTVAATTKKIGAKSDVQGGRADPVRMHFLSKFADQEGSYFLKKFYERYKGISASDLLPTLAKGSRASPRQAAVMFRYVRPTGTLDQMTAFIQQTAPTKSVSPALAEKWYNEFAPGRFNLQDQGFLARVHPLELWLVAYLDQHPKATLTEALHNSKDERQLVYEWLFKTPSVRAQDIRIRTLMEMESFEEIHKQWKKVGYPFNSIVPSLATSIGSSGDRPIALAELVGIILNDGKKLPLVRLNELHLAAGTPYETKLVRQDRSDYEQVLKPEVARALKRAMANVVESGTARRVYKTYTRSDGKAYVIGGKTGTGDHRHETYGPGGHVISSRVVNRTATFAFYLGDRFFGVISAHVPGEEAAKFDFTSALAAELLKIVRTSLIPMIESSGAGLSPFTNEEPLVGATNASSAATKDTDSEEGTFTFKEAELPPEGLPDGSVSLPASPPSESKPLAKGAALRQKLRRSIVLPPPG
jgi:membrane peptidoglycan carboxypeptidase